MSAKNLMITSSAATSSQADQAVARPVRFELPRARNFIEKSLSEDTRRAYTRALLDFFSFIRKPPAQVETEDVIAYRDDLIKKKRRKARTVNMKLSVIRAYFGYLKAAGDLETNPADTELVSVPPPPDDMAGRVLTPEEVGRLINTPDRSRVEGARDHALLLVLARTSLRVSEVRNLRASSIVWSHGRWTARVKVKGGRERTIQAPDDVSAHNNKGLALRNLAGLQAGLSRYYEASESYAQAIAAYDEALRRAPDYVYVHNNKGNALQSRGDLQVRLSRHDEALESYAKAIAACDQALRRAPDYSSAHNNRGAVLTSLGDLWAKLSRHGEALENYAKAIAAFDEALRKAPGDVSVHNNKGNALISRGKLQAMLSRHGEASESYALATEVYEEALRRAPDNVYVHNNKGLALRNLGDSEAKLSRHAEASKIYAEAVAAFDEALRIAPGHVQIYNNRVNALQRLGELQAGLSRHDEASRSDRERMPTIRKKLYQVFLSHSSGDKAHVEKIAMRLVDETGIKPFLDKWHLVPGEPWRTALEEALNDSETCAIFLGPAGLGPWENEEMRAALDEHVKDKSLRVIPVLLPGANPRDNKTLPRFLRHLTWVDFRTGIDEEEPFHQLVAGITGRSPGIGEVDERMNNLFLNEAEKGFLQALADEGVRYVLIGGHAVNFHGHERPVEDLDIVIEASMVNARKFLAVYDRLVPVPRPAELTIEKLLKPRTKIPVPYYGIEVLTSIDAVPFGELYRDSIVIESQGVEIRMISREHLLRSKKDTGRPKDQEDYKAMVEHRLFSKVDINAVLEHQKDLFNQALQKLPAETIRQMCKEFGEGGEPTLRAFFYEHWLHVPVIDDAKIECIEDEEAQVDGRGNPNRIILAYEKPFYVPGRRVTLAAPFEGDSGIFDLQPNTYTSSVPGAEIVDREVRVTYEVESPVDYAAIKQNFIRTLGEITQYLRWLSESVSHFNGELTGIGRRYVLERKTRLDMDAARMEGIKEMEYDVAISFAGEQRKEARDIAKGLTDAGVKVFFDEYEDAELWGKNLYEHLSEVYKDRAHYCIILVSAAYAKKVWTSHERRSAQARALQESQEYILPVRIDLTELPGLLPTVGYLDFNRYGAEGICQAFLRKIGRGNSVSEMSPELKITTSPLVLIQEPDAEIYRFIPVVNSKWGSSQIVLTLEPDHSGDGAFLDGLQARARMTVAYGNHVAICKVIDITHNKDAGASRWELTLHPESSEFGPAFELGGTATTSKDEYAEKRVRRLLLNEELPGKLDDLNQMMEEIFLRGQGSTTQILGSPFPQLYGQYGKEPKTFLDVAWVMGAFLLRTTGTVAEICRFELTLTGQSLVVDFIGSRKKEYSNRHAYEIKVQGTCDLGRLEK